MGMIIAWQCLNRLANPHDGRFTDAFLVVTPGITIKDRLRVLLPGDPESIYRKLSLVPEQQRELIARAKIIPTLMLFRQNGEEAKGWRDLGFWWPVIVTPRGAVTSIFASTEPALN